MASPNVIAGIVPGTISVGVRLPMSVGSRSPKRSVMVFSLFVQGISFNYSMMASLV